MDKIIGKELLICVRDFLRAELTDKSGRLVPGSFCRAAWKNYLRRRKARGERIKIILALPECDHRRQALYARLKRRADKIGWDNVARRYELPKGSFPAPPVSHTTIRNSFRSTRAQKFADARRGILPEYDRRNPKLRGFLERHLGPSFARVLKRAMDEKNISAPDLYTEIGMDRKLFSKIMSDRDYHPGKKSVILLAFGLKLDEEAATELLRVGGYYLSASCRRDLIVIYCLRHKIYDVYLVDELLEEFDAGSLHRI